MTPSISVVFNTLNEEANISKAISSVSWADEILVCDMHSTDKTAEVSKKLGAKVISFKRIDFVEPARNFAISKATGDWVLILDPDEQVTDKLKDKLVEIVKQNQVDFVRIPRKNIIFGKWVKSSLWWPDLNIRFFKKGKVEWEDKIHRPPKTSGVGLDLPAQEDLAIQHSNYQSVGQFIQRMNRYTDIEAAELKNNGYKFSWQDILQKPLDEFLSRYFANKGYQDGLHGLGLSLLQSFSFLIVYLKVWEKEKFNLHEVEIGQVKEISKQSGKQIDYWFKFIQLSPNPLKRLIQKAKNKF